MRQSCVSAAVSLLGLQSGLPVPPVFSIAGCPGSGKTRLMTATIGLLADRGLRVAALKHSCHAFDVDRPGKDSWAMRDAGAVSVLLASPTSVALMEATPAPWSPEDLVSLFAERVDLVLAESQGGSRWAQVEVWRSAVSAAPTLPPRSVLALVTDDEVTHPAPPISPDRPEQMAALVLASLGFAISFRGLRRA